MVTMVGQLVGDYRIESLLASTYTGQVYRGVHVRLNRPAAIKVLNVNLATVPAFLARFQRETQAVAALKHPNIVEVLDFGEQEGFEYLIMELVPDGSLSSLLRRRDAGEGLALSLGVDLMRQAAEGLAYAHAQGVVHRAINPNNLLLKRVGASAPPPEQYWLKITDFGLARLTEIEEGDLTHLGAPVGTLAYISPEQCRGGDLDGRSDLYSLGVVLYEVVTGYMPFQVKSLPEAIDRHLNAMPVPPREVREDLPILLQDVILRCLAKKPEDRYATGSDLASELRRVLQEIRPKRADDDHDGHPRPQPEILLAQDTLTLTPGHPTAMKAVVANLGGVVDRLLVTVEGPPADWVQVSRPEVSLNPGARETVEIQVAVPRVRDIRPGDYRVTLRARSKADPTVSGTAHARWTVEPFQASRITLAPLTVHGQGQAAYTVKLYNDGIVETHHTLSAEDDEQALIYEFDRNTVTLQPGAEVEVTLVVRVPRDRLGRAQAYGIKVQSRVDAADSLLITTGQYIHEPPDVVRVYLDQDTLTLTPGEPATFKATLANLGRSTHALAVAIEGMPANWIDGIHRGILLGPSMHEAIELRISVPRAPASTPGVYPVTLRVRSPEDAGLTASVQAHWTVLPYYAQSVNLEPSLARGRGAADYAATVRNEGNTTDRYTWAGEDNQARLRYRFSQETVEVERGASASVGLTVQGRRRLAGKPLPPYPFTLRSQSAGSKAAQSVTGQFINVALMRGWVFGLLVIMLSCVMLYMILYIASPH